MLQYRKHVTYIYTDVLEIYHKYMHDSSKPSSHVGNSYSRLIGNYLAEPYLCLLCLPYLAELITVKENSCSCQLRSDGCLQEKKTNKKFGDRAFSICGPVLWNRLPKCMKEINSLDKFKKELKTHLFKEAFG